MILPMIMMLAPLLMKGYQMYQQNKQQKAGQQALQNLPPQWQALAGAPMHPQVKATIFNHLLTPQQGPSPIPTGPNSVFVPGQGGQPGQFQNNPNPVFKPQAPLRGKDRFLTLQDGSVYDTVEQKLVHEGPAPPAKLSPFQEAEQRARGAAAGQAKSDAEQKLPGQLTYLNDSLAKADALIKNAPKVTPQIYGKTPGVALLGRTEIGKAVLETFTSDPQAVVDWKADLKKLARSIQLDEVKRLQDPRITDAERQILEEAVTGDIENMALSQEKIMDLLHGIQKMYAIKKEQAEQQAKQYGIPIPPGQSQEQVEILEIEWPNA